MMVGRDGMVPSLDDSPSLEPLPSFLTNGLDERTPPRPKKVLKRFVEDVVLYEFAASQSSHLDMCC